MLLDVQRPLPSAPRACTCLSAPASHPPHTRLTPTHTRLLSTAPAAILPLPSCVRLCGQILLVFHGSAPTSLCQEAVRP